MDQSETTKTGNQRWTAKRKRQLVVQLLRGETTLAQASLVHDLPELEICAWLEAAERGMENALCGERSQLENKLQELNEAIRLAPQDASMYQERASFWEDRGEWEKAEADYTEAIRLAPEDASMYLERALFWLCRNGEKAKADYAEAIRLAPKDAYLYLERAIFWELREEWGKADADYAEAIQLAPKDAPMYQKRASFWKRRGECGRRMRTTSK